MFIQGFIKARRSTCQGFTNSFSSFSSSSSSSSSYWTINLKNVAVKAIFQPRQGLCAVSDLQCKNNQGIMLQGTRKRAFFSAFTQYLSRQATKNRDNLLTRLSLRH